MMFFRREDEFSLMRKELIDYYNKEYARMGAKQQDDSLGIVLSKIEQISSMSNSDLLRLYREVFGWCRPVKL